MLIIIKSLSGSDIEYEFDTSISFQLFIASLTEKILINFDKVKVVACLEKSVVPFRLPQNSQSIQSTAEYLAQCLGVNITTSPSLYILIIDQSQKPWLGAQFKPATPMARLKALGLKDKIPEEFMFSSIDEINAWPYLKKFLLEKFILRLEDAKDNGQLFSNEKEIESYFADLRKERERLEYKLNPSNRRRDRNNELSTEYEVTNSEISYDSDLENVEISLFNATSQDIRPTYKTIQAKSNIIWHVLDKAETHYNKLHYLNLYDIYQMVKYTLKDTFRVRANTSNSLDVVRSPDDVLQTHSTHELRNGKLKILGKLIPPASARFLNKSGFFKHGYNYTETAHHICALVKSIYRK